MLPIWIRKKTDFLILKLFPIWWFLYDQFAFWNSCDQTIHTLSALIKELDLDSIFKYFVFNPTCSHLCDVQIAHCTIATADSKFIHRLAFIPVQTGSWSLCNVHSVMIPTYGFNLSTTVDMIFLLLFVTSYGIPNRF